MKTITWLLILIFSFNIVAVPMTAASDEPCPMEIMQHQQEQQNHDCCDDAITASVNNQHQCEDCSQCQVGCGASCCIFDVLSLKSHTLSFDLFSLLGLGLYPEPLSSEIIPPIV